MDEYIEFVNGLAEYCVLNNTPNGDQRNPLGLSVAQIESFREFTRVREEVATGEEMNAHQYQIPLCIQYIDTDAHGKLIMRLIYNDICIKADRLLLARDLGRYVPAHPIFQLDGLYNVVREDHELINFNALRYRPLNHMFLYHGRFLRSGRFLRPQLLNYLTTIGRQHQLYIRLDPYFMSETMPPCPLQEEALRPVNPEWIRNLCLFKGEGTGGHYFLPDIDQLDPANPAEQQRIWDRDIKKVRSLEISAERYGDGNLRMMLEEITEDIIGGEYYICRCIHLDTDDIVGTVFEESTLNHIDIAINIYDRTAFETRKNQSLSNGRVVVDATLRCHLARLEKVPFTIIRNIAWLFFESEILLSEWIHDQFEMRVS